MIKHKLLLSVLFAVACLMPLAAKAQLLSVELGDQRYYTHGPRYLVHGRQLVWVPGHWTHHHRVWVHGRYIRRDGEWRDDRRYDDRRDDRRHEDRGDDRRYEYRGDDYRR